MPSHRGTLLAVISPRPLWRLPKDPSLPPPLRGERVRAADGANGLQPHVGYIYGERERVSWSEEATLTRSELRTALVRLPFAVLPFFFPFIAIEIGQRKFGLWGWGNGLLLLLGGFVWTIVHEVVFFFCLARKMSLLRSILGAACPVLLPFLISDKGDQN